MKLLIQRYELDYDWGPQPTDDGEWVKYSDLLNLILNLNQEFKELINIKISKAT